MSIEYPKCQCCGEEIYDEKCYIKDDSDPWNNCLCNVCVGIDKRRLGQMDLCTYEELIEKLDDMYTWTPRPEERYYGPDRYDEVLCGDPPGESVFEHDEDSERW